MKHTIALVVVLLAAPLTVKMLYAAPVTYQVIPAGLGPGCLDNLTGGSITTDGTFGLLSPENILSMSVDIRIGTWVLERGMPPLFLDGSTTLDLSNAALSIDGQLLATPNGIFVATPPPSPFDRDFGTSIPEPDPNVVTYSVSLDGGDAHVIWSSTNLESYGVNNFVGIDSVPAGGVIVHFENSGLIARMVPEPASALLMLLGFAALAARRR